MVFFFFFLNFYFHLFCFEKKSKLKKRESIEYRLNIFNHSSIAIVKAGTVAANRLYSFGQNIY